VLVVALIVQLAIGVGFVVLAVNGFPLVGGGGSADTASSPRATGPFAPVPQATVNRFDTARAFALIRRQVAVGQRPAGSPKLRALAERLRPLLPGGRFEPVPGHPGLRNIVGVLPGRRLTIGVRRYWASGRALERGNPPARGPARGSAGPTPPAGRGI